MEANVDEALCRERFRSIGLEVARSERRRGPFAAALYDVWIASADGAETRYVYKVPPEERNGEFEVLGALGRELAPWLPEGIARFASPPKAIAMRYAGEPILPPRERRRRRGGGAARGVRPRHGATCRAAFAHGSDDGALGPRRQGGAVRI
ncbi:MAG TPA: hypothetical protein VEZ72_01690 [Paenibacillus sp.]|nr:hypothetical protein [Paenibacillus sp.]